MTAFSKNNNLSDSRKIVQVNTDDHSFSLGYEAANGLYTLVDLTRFYLVSKSDLLSQLVGNIKVTGEDTRSTNEIYTSLAGGTLYCFYSDGGRGISSELGFTDSNNALIVIMYKATSWRGAGIIIPMLGVNTTAKMWIGKIYAENRLQWIAIE